MQGIRFLFREAMASSIRADQPGLCAVSVSITDILSWSGRFLAPLTMSVPWAASRFRSSVRLCSMQVTPVKCQVQVLPPAVQVI